MEQTRVKTKNRRTRAILWIAGAFAVLCAAVLIHYRGVRPIVTTEYGQHAPRAEDYTARDATLADDGERPKCGWHVLNLKIGGVPTPVLLHVRDTVAPSATAVDREVAVGTVYGPDAFVKDIRDADIVKLTFAEQPDFLHEGEQTVEILLSDGSGNRSVVPVRISVRATHPSVALEAGSELPTAETFLLDGLNGTLDRPIDPEVMHHVGTVQIAVTTDTGVHSECELQVIDTVAPEAQGTLLHLLPDQSAAPEECLLDATDATDLTFAFASEPDYSRRDVQKLVVRVTDEGGNATEVPVSILISGVRPKVVEARLEPLTAADFENEEGDEIAVEPFIPSVPGTYPVEIKTNGISQTVAVTVVDTAAPLIAENPDTRDTVFYTKHEYLPEDFFTASDLTGATLTFSVRPDFERAGEQTVSVTAEDACGNRASAERTVRFVDDTEAPSIYGVINRTCYINEPIAYFKEVFAEDVADGPVEVTVESEVVTYQTGTYRVVYRAVDRSGNAASRECTFTLIEQTVTEEQLKALAQRIMGEITTPDMVNAEKLKAIFDYVQKHVVYVNGSNHNYTDWRKAAYDGIVYGKGDCYNIYAATRALLDETDIPYLSVERVRTSTRRTRHYWVHVNVGTGWYVFDPTWARRHKAYCFMWTKRQCNSFRLYWNYDESKYPPLATEPFDYEAVVAAERQNAKP